MAYLVLSLLIRVEEDLHLDAHLGCLEQCYSSLVDWLTESNVANQPSKGSLQIGIVTRLLCQLSDPLSAHRILMIAVTMPKPLVDVLAMTVMLSLYRLLDAL